MVVTLSPSSMTASVRQELIRRPLIITVQGFALPVVAAFFCTGQVKMLAQRVEQGGPRVDLQRPRLAIHVEADRVVKALRSRRRKIGQIGWLFQSDRRHGAGPQSPCC